METHGTAKCQKIFEASCHRWNMKCGKHLIPLLPDCDYTNKTVRVKKIEMKWYFQFLNSIKFSSAAFSHLLLLRPHCTPRNGNWKMKCINLLTFYHKTWNEGNALPKLKWNEFIGTLDQREICKWKMNANPLPNHIQTECYREIYLFGISWIPFTLMII